MTCSEARLNANRQNAQRSTGPKTPEGKARAAQNALRHGLRARGASLLPTEDPDAYHDFAGSVVASLHPATPLEHEFATRAADILWRLRRVPGAEADVLSADVERRFTAAQQKYERDLATHDEYCRRRPTAKNLPDPPLPPNASIGTAAHSLASTFCSTGADKHNPYLALQRYETTLDRALSRTLKELRQLQKDRRDHPADEADEAPLPNEPIAGTEATSPSPLEGGGRGEGEVSANAPAPLAQARPTNPPSPGNPGEGRGEGSAAPSNTCSFATPAPQSLHAPPPRPPNEPTSPSRPLRDLAPSRLPKCELPNEPTTPHNTNPRIDLTPPADPPANPAPPPPAPAA